MYTGRAGITRGSAGSGVRIRFVHFAAPPISRLIARRGHVGAARGMLRDKRASVQAPGEGWDSGMGGGRLTPAGKRIARRASPRNSITRAAPL